MFRLATTAVLTATLTTSAMAEITVEDPYARSSNQRAGAAFMMIINTGDTADRLIAAESDASMRAELHTHLEDANGVMRMIEVEDGFEIPAGGSVHLRRGGDHVMFMGLNVPFEQGGTVPLRLIFESGAEISLEVPVDNERMGGMTHSH